MICSSMALIFRIWVVLSYFLIYCLSICCVVLSSAVVHKVSCALAEL